MMWRCSVVSFIRKNHQNSTYVNKITSVEEKRNRNFPPVKEMRKFILKKIIHSLILIVIIYEGNKVMLNPPEPPPQSIQKSAKEIVNITGRRKWRPTWRRLSFVWAKKKNNTMPRVRFRSIRFDTMESCCFQLVVLKEEVWEEIFT